jgi:hypothetical protein
MANLFWKTAKGVKVMQEKPFVTEAEFERTVYNAKELLEDIFFLKRQVRDGGKIGIPDIVGVDVRRQMPSKRSDGRTRPLSDLSPRAHRIHSSALV